MLVRWITKQLGTSSWQNSYNLKSVEIVDVRVLKDTAGNSSSLVKEKISQSVNLLKNGKSVVIACDHGISRSNAIAAAVLAEHENISFSESLQRVIDATNENGIKVDLINELREVLGIKLKPISTNKLVVLGSKNFIGRSIKHLIKPLVFSINTEDDVKLISNPALLNEVLSNTTVQYILFCWSPAEPDTNKGVGQLIEYLRNVLEVCRIRCIGFIFLSGHQVFSGYKGNQIYFTEKDVTLPDTACGDGLYLAETLVKQYEYRHKVRILIVRTSHIYGAEDNRKNILNTFVQNALENREIITHRYQNGSPKIDFLHVNDLANALRLAIENNMTGILHIVSGNVITTYNLAKLIIELTNSTSTLSSIHLSGRYNIIQLKSEFAVPVLNWRPLINLKDGLSNVIDKGRDGITRG